MRSEGVLIQLKLLVQILSTDRIFIFPFFLSATTSPRTQCLNLSDIHNSEQMSNCVYQIKFGEKDMLIVLGFYFV